MNAVRGTLLAGAIVFACSSAFLIVTPGLFATWLGIDASDGTTWSLRMVGAVLVALSGQMVLVRRGDERTVRTAAIVMIVGGGLMTFVTLILPAEWTLLRWAYLVFGIGFCLAYGIGLIRTRPNQASNL
jgi:uncharacterized membrane protein